MDNLVLFAHANPENCLAIREVLSDFCAKSGQTISTAKSRVFFSPNVNPNQREALSNLLGFTITSNLVKYLGFRLNTQATAGKIFPLS